MLIGGGPLRLSESTAVDSGNSDTRSIQVVLFHLRVTYRSCQWLLESFDLGSLCWLTFGRKSTVWWKISSCLDLMPKTWSLKEDAGKYQCITSKANNTLKVSKVGHCASWCSWISCLQLWHKAYPSGGSDRQLLFAKELKETKHVFICDYFLKFPFLYRAKTSFWSLRDHLIDLFSIEEYPDEIVSDNGSPFQSKEFAKFLSGLGIKHTTSSPGYPHS